MLARVCQQTVGAVIDIEDAPADFKPELKVRGPMGPIAEINIEEGKRRSVAIPREAKYFAFAHPADYAWSTPSGKESWNSAEKKLETLNLANETWAFFLLVGGKCLRPPGLSLLVVAVLALSGVACSSRGAPRLRLLQLVRSTGCDPTLSLA